MLVIEVEVQTPARLEHQRAVAHLVGLAGLDAAQHGDQATLEVVLAGEAAGQLLFGGAGRGEVDPGPVVAPGQTLGLGDHPAGQILRVTFAALEQHLADVEIAQQHPGLIEAAQRAAQAEAIPAGENAGDIGLVLRYERAGDGVGRWLFHLGATVWRRPRSRHFYFGSGSAGLGQTRPTGGFAARFSSSGRHFTASTQRPHSVGCAATAPTSVSQCQQRSHFWPAAFVTSTLNDSGSPSMRISSCDTLSNSRRYS